MNGVGGSFNIPESNRIQFNKVDGNYYQNGEIISKDMANAIQFSDSSQKDYIEDKDLATKNSLENDKNLAADFEKYGGYPDEGNIPEETNATSDSNATPDSAGKEILSIMRDKNGTVTSATKYIKKDDGMIDVTPEYNKINYEDSKMVSDAKAQTTLDEFKTKHSDASKFKIKWNGPNNEDLGVQEIFTQKN